MPLPATTVDYAALLADIEARIGTAQVEAALASGNDLISLYRNIGRAVGKRQEKEMSNDAHLLPSGWHFPNWQILLSVGKA